jgi:hypothetical protein
MKRTASEMRIRVVVFAGCGTVLTGVPWRHRPRGPGTKSCAKSCLAFGAPPSGTFGGLGLDVWLGTGAPTRSSSAMVLIWLKSGDSWRKRHVPDVPNERHHQRPEIEWSMLPRLGDFPTYKKSPLAKITRRCDARNTVKGNRTMAAVLGFIWPRFCPHCLSRLGRTEVRAICLPSTVTGLRVSALTQAIFIWPSA